MRTTDCRQARAIKERAEAAPGELLPPHVLEAVSNLRPAFDRIRRGDWRLMVVGAQSAQERDEARLLPVRLLDLADAVDDRR